MPGILTEHGADALAALVKTLPKGAVFAEIGACCTEETFLIAEAIRDARNKVKFLSIGEEYNLDRVKTLSDLGLDRYVTLIQGDPEDVADDMGIEALDGAFLRSAPQMTLIRRIWTWSPKIKLNGLLLGNWDDESRVAIMKETKGAYTRIGFDQSIWKIPLYTR